jgi:uncharacterized membrane protein YdjX (TVP38/TMEM64 family)
MTHPRRWFFALVMVLIIAGVTTAAFMLRGSINADGLRAWVASLGIWAPVGFIVIYTFGAIALVPGGVFDLTGGALFGPYLGSVIDLIGGTLGAAGSFLVARYLVRDWVEIRAGPRMQRVMQSVDEDGWQFVAFLRLVPIFPYTLVNYVLGLTRIPFHHYVVATMVFMAPSTIAYTWIGYASRELIAGDTSTARYALIVLALLGLLYFLPRFFKKFKRTAIKE